jgi:HEAT repeat protein
MPRLLTLTLALVLLAPVALADEPSFNGRPLSGWLTMLKEDPTARKRRAAVVALGQIAGMDKTEFGNAIGAVGRALRDDADPAVRRQAAAVLGQQPVEDSTIVLGDLTTAVRLEKDPTVRREVAVTLGRFGKLAKQAVPALTGALADKDAGVQTAAADALGRVGADAAPAAPELLKLVASADAGVKRAATFALGRVEPADKPPVAAALVGVLKSAGDNGLRREAITAIGLLGEAECEVVPALAGQLKDKAAEMRLLTLDSVGKIGPAARRLEPQLTELFRTDPDPAVRRVSLRTLVKGLGTDAKQLVPAMAERLAADTDFEVRAAIAQEFGSLGVDGEAAIPALRKAQRDPQVRVREAAVAAIKQIDRAKKSLSIEPKKS